jgi:chemotaxis protein histidine kinase CheA
MSDSQIIHAPHTLKKAKMGSGPGKLDTKAIACAESAVKEMAKDYTQWAQEDVSSLDAALGEARARPDDHAQAIRTLFRVALDMKGQGTSFGYRLITEVGDSLASFVEERKSLSPFDQEVVASHISAMRAVFSEAVRDDGGDTGRALVEGLHRLVEKAVAQS